MRRDPRCPKCSVILARDRAHVCRVDVIDEALQGVDVSAIAGHDRMVSWMAGWDTQTVGWLVDVIAAARTAGPRA